MSGEAHSSSGHGVDSTLSPVVGSSVVDTTSRLQGAIDRAAGGGTVRVSAGNYVCTTLVLRPDMTFRLERGATIHACEDITAYPELLRPSDGNKDRQRFHLIVADECDNLTIEGDGVIDGHGEAFWDPPVRTLMKEGHTRESLGLRPQIEDDSPFWRERSRRPSPLVDLRNCRNLVIRDITIRNSPGWTLHPFCCDDVTIRGITIDNNEYGPNTDGIDVNGCRNLVIAESTVRCGDDAIILKSTKDARACENIVVTGCILESNCAAIGLGAEVTYAIRNVTVTGCVVPKALRIVQLEMWEAGLIENVLISGLTGANMTDIPLERPIYLDIQHHGRTDPALGRMRNITISGLSCTTRGRILLTAADGAEIENVTLRDVTLYYPEIEDPQISVPSSRSSQMSNDSPVSRAVRAAVVADNVKGLLLDNVVTVWPEAGRPEAGIAAGGDSRGSAAAGPSDDPAGRFNGDLRKQASVVPMCPMHALYLRNCSEVELQSPRLRGCGGAERIREAAGEV